MEEIRRKTRSHFTRTYRTSYVNSEESVNCLVRSFSELESMGITTSTSQTFTVDEESALTVQNGSSR